MSTGAVSLEEQIACVRRELAMRKSVYPRRCAEGRMNHLEADREIRAMEAVLETLLGLESPGLFGGEGAF